MKIPTDSAFRKYSLGRQADTLRTIQQERIAAQKAVDETKRREAALLDILQAKASKGGQPKLVVGSIGKVSFGETTKGQVEDWPALYEYIAKEDAFDLLERRLGNVAFRDRVEDGVKVPGVKAIKILKATISAVK